MDLNEANHKWRYSIIHRCVCKVIEEGTLWGQQTVVRVWLPNQEVVVRVPWADLKPLWDSFTPENEIWRIAYVATAAKVAEVLEGVSRPGEQVLLAPLDSPVIPLPHQIHTLSRAISGDRVRYLLADEVGLGKTIEAGLILKELKLRGRAKRILIVAPKGLTTQWVTEMKTHFGEHFNLVLGSDLKAWERLTSKGDQHISVWSALDQVIVSLDSVKPIERRRGWTPERVDEYNRHRFEDLVTSGWDLVIVDEAHRLGGSTDQVARYRLGKGLAEAAPYLLLLSATPHQGKTDAFHRLIKLLDEKAFPDCDSVCRERVAPYVIRTEKRSAINADGEPLFKPRLTQMAPVSWSAHDHLQELLYEAVTDYVRKGYNQALEQNKRHLGFLMILMQRLVVSSTRAIAVTLGRRLENIREGSEKLKGFAQCSDDCDNFDYLYDLDGQELLDELLAHKISALGDEAGQVEALLESARRCEAAGVDVKAEALLGWLYKLQSEENDPNLKVLIFTEFVPTQAMLAEFLTDRGIEVVTLNGSMDMVRRQAAQEAFLSTHRILISTDAGGEGLNLQAAHVVINYDLPWNPMKLEQRIGRVDRIGQTKTVRAVNLLLEQSVEFRVVEVLEQKLAVIFEEFGIDKTGDVLDSAQAGELFGEVFTQSIINPENIENYAERTALKICREINNFRESSTIYGWSEEFNPREADRLRNHPLPHWIERMTLAYLKANGGLGKLNKFCWDLTWPDGEQQSQCTFSPQDLARLTGATLLGLDNSRIRGLALNSPQVVPGQLVPQVTVPGLPSGLSGLWGLFEIRLQTGLQNNRVLGLPQLRRGWHPVFISDDGQLLQPTSRHIWDALQTAEVKVLGAVDSSESSAIYNQLMAAAEQTGSHMFELLRQTHLTALAQEEEKGLLSFNFRRKSIENIGLPEVRRYRQKRLEAVEAQWQRELEVGRQIMPEIRPSLMLKIIQEVWT